MEDLEKDLKDLDEMLNRINSKKDSDSGDLRGGAKKRSSKCKTKKSTKKRSSSKKRTTKKRRTSKHGGDSLRNDNGVMDTNDMNELAQLEDGYLSGGKKKRSAKKSTKKANKKRSTKKSTKRRSAKKHGGAIKKRKSIKRKRTIKRKRDDLFNMDDADEMRNDEGEELYGGAAKKKRTRRHKKRKDLKGGKKSSKRKASKKSSKKSSKRKASKKSKKSSKKVAKRTVKSAIRHFKVIEVNGKKVDDIGRVEIKKSGTPLSAARKLFRSICKTKFHLKGEKKAGCKCTFVIQETTQGSAHKQSSYKAHYLKLSPSERAKSVRYVKIHGKRTKIEFKMKPVVKALKMK